MFWAFFVDILATFSEHLAKLHSIIWSHRILGLPGRNGGPNFKFSRQFSVRHEAALGLEPAADGGRSCRPAEERVRTPTEELRLRRSRFAQPVRVWLECLQFNNESQQEHEHPHSQSRVIYSCICGLYYKRCTIVIYDRNHSMIVGPVL